MLALATGWTPDIINGEADNGIDDGFRQAAHMALYGQALEQELRDLEEVIHSPAPRNDARALGIHTKARMDAQKAREDILAAMDLNDG